MPAILVSYFQKLALTFKHPCCSKNLPTLLSFYSPPVTLEELLPHSTVVVQTLGRQVGRGTTTRLLLIHTFLSS